LVLRGLVCFLSVKRGPRAPALLEQRLKDKREGAFYLSQHIDYLVFLFERPAWPYLTFLKRNQRKAVRPRNQRRLLIAMFIC
jgi:hypothetical protein